MSQKMKLLLSVIVAWLSINFDLPSDHEYPKIEFLPTSAMSELRYGSSTKTQTREVLAIYDDRTRTIFLSDTWTGRTPGDISILVHEMVHHLQNMNDHEYACPAAREALAYHAQAKWLELFGRDLFTDFSIDPMTLKLTTHCLGY